MKKSKIKTLADLQEEKRRLGLMSEVTKREISHSLGLMRSETKNFTLNKVALPLGITAATGMLVSKAISSSDDKPQKIKQAGGNSIVNTLIALLPFAMKFLNNQSGVKTALK